jgi:hypothetical protein
MPEEKVSADKTFKTLEGFRQSKGEISFLLYLGPPEDGEVLAASQSLNEIVDIAHKKKNRLGRHNLFILMCVKYMIWDGEKDQEMSYDTWGWR